MYKQLPETRELIELTNPLQKPTKMKKFGDVLNFLLVMGLLILVIVALMFLLRAPYAESAAFVALTFVCIVLVLWIIFCLLEIFFGIGNLFNFDQKFGDKLDEKCTLELELLNNFRAIPRGVLLSRHNRLELEMSIWEKWLDVARLFGLLLPLSIIVGKIYLNTEWFVKIEVLLAAFLIGVILGAVMIRSVLKKLHRVSYLLKSAGEQRRFSPSIRERRKR